MTKIVHVSLADSNGAGLCAYRICLAQRALGEDSEMIVLRRHHHDAFVHQVGKKRYFLRSALRKLRKLVGQTDDLNVCRQLGAKYHTVYTLPVSPVDMSGMRLLREADVIHIHWVGGYLDYPSFFRTFADKPVVFTLHDENALYGIAHIESQRLSDNPLERKSYEIKRAAMRRVRRLGIVFLAQMSYRLYADSPMIEGAQKTVICNSVDTGAFCPKDRAEARRRLGISTDVRLFALSACNLDEPRKGLPLLSEALWHIDPSYRILAIGHNRSHALCPHDNVVYAGHCDGAEAMSWLLSAADYYCLPSMKENFAQVPLEAMACGLPVIAFPCSGTEELLCPDNGVRCDGYTVESLESGLRKALATAYDPQHIRADVARRFSPRTMAEAYMAFYRRVIGQQGDR